MAKKAESAPIAPASPTPPEQRRRDLAKLAELQKVHDKAEADYERAKTTAKARKEIVEDAAASVFDFVRSIFRPAGPLFDRWELTRIADLEHLPPGVLERLAGEGIDDLGGLFAWQSDGKSITDIVGITEAAAEAIEAAVAAFWAERKEAAEANGQKKDKGEENGA